MSEKLLLLGIDTATKFIVAEAKRKGMYVILSDYQTVEQCPLKKVVDEAWFLNVGELDELEKKAKEAGVTAVMAGNHEFCLDCAKELSKRLGLHFYANDYCWSVARNKLRFKELCHESGLPVAKDYTIDGPIEYPVCVKPSDSSAQRGISVVYEEKDIQAAYEKALAFSENKKIIIEQFLTGKEVLLIGYADQGNYHLFYAGDVYSVVISGKDCISMGVHSPAGAKEILDNYGEGLWTLLRKMEHKNGLFILQGFVEEDGQFYLLESGIRFDGGVCAHIVSKVYDINPVGWMIDLARGVQPEIDWSKLNVTGRDKVYAEHVIYCRGGKIARIEGEEEAAAVPGVEFLLKRFKVGNVVENVGNMTQCAYYMHFVADSPEELLDALKKVNDTLKIYDEDGNSLLIYETEFEKMFHSMTR